MEKKTYTPKQMEDAERFAALLSRVPEEKRDTVIRTTEAVIIGVELATKLNTGEPATA